MDALNGLLRNAHVQDILSSVAIQGTAAFTALLLIFRFHASKKRVANYVTNFSKIARTVDQKEDADEAEKFDVIVVGGGAY